VTPDQTQTTQHPGAVQGPFSSAYRIVTLSILALVTIIAFESMAVSTVMPEVATELRAVRSYGLAFSVMLTAQLLGIVLAGVWIDRSGPLPAILSGQVLLGAGSFICGAARNFGMLLLGRGLAGLGAGLLVVVFFVIIGRVYPDSVRPQLFAMVSTAWVVPSLLGPPLAAWIALHFSWRWVFWVVVIPVTITAVVLSARSHVIGAAGEAVSNRDHTSHVRAAWLGLAIAIAAGAVQFGTHELVLEWSPATVLAALGIVGLLITAPLLLPAGTWIMRRGLPSVMLARFLASVAFFGTVAFIPLFLVNERGLSIGVAGIVLAIGSVGWTIGSWIQGNRRFDGRREMLITAGGTALALGTAACVLSAWLTLPLPAFPLALILMGLGMGMTTATTSVLMLMLTTEAEHGEASTSLNLADVLGSVIGIAAGGALFAALHRAAGQDAKVFAMMWLISSAAALVLILTGPRTRRYL